MKVATGLDVLVSDRLDLLRGRRVGVLCHPASVTSDLVHIVDRLIAAGVRPVRLFGPEHGVRGEAQDMKKVVRDTIAGPPPTAAPRAAPTSAPSSKPPSASARSRATAEEDAPTSTRPEPTAGATSLAQSC